MCVRKYLRLGVRGAFLSHCLATVQVVVCAPRYQIGKTLDCILVAIICDCHKKLLATSIN